MNHVGKIDIEAPNPTPFMAPFNKLVTCVITVAPVAISCVRTHSRILSYRVRNLSSVAIIAMMKESKEQMAKPVRQARLDFTESLLGWGAIAS